MRLINADALIKKAGRLWEEMPDGEELSKELMKAINHAPTIGEWISVKDRLPEENGDYLVCVKGYANDYRIITIRSFTLNMHKLDPYTFYGKRNCKPGWYQYDSEYGYVDEYRVTHWQELPEPPKEEEK